MAHPAIVDEKQLMEMADCRRRAELLRWLDDRRIGYICARSGKVSTTVDALTAAATRSANDGELEFADGP